MAADFVETARSMLSPCRLCPRHCGADRLNDQTGFCRTGALARVASAGAHFGEEPVLVGPGGSGTIFFQGCNLDCVFCQNYDLSHESGGTAVHAERLSRIMLDLQGRHCSNINFVTPTHVVPQVLEATARARDSGLRLPIVYNCGGYESVDTLALLEGRVDVYMPDFKWGNSLAGRKYSGVPDYTETATAALAEMYRQVGPLEANDRGLAVRGVMVRHLVMPMDLADSRKVIEIVAETAPASAINVMGQYRPCYRAHEFPELLLLPKRDDIRQLREYAAAQGLHRLA